MSRLIPVSIGWALLVMSQIDCVAAELSIMKLHDRRMALIASWDDNMLFDMYDEGRDHAWSDGFFFREYSQVQGIEGRSTVGSPEFLPHAVFRNELYVSLGPNDPRELWDRQWYRFTMDGFVLVPEMATVTGAHQSTRPEIPFVFQDRIYYSARVGELNELVRYDGERIEVIDPEATPLHLTSSPYQAYLGDYLLFEDTSGNVYRLKGDEVKALGRPSPPNQRFSGFLRGYDRSEGHTIGNHLYGYGHRPSNTESYTIYRTDGETLEQVFIPWPEEVFSQTILDGHVYGQVRGPNGREVTLYSYDGEQVRRVPLHNAEYVESVHLFPWFEPYLERYAGGIVGKNVTTERGLEVALLINDELHVLRPFPDERNDGFEVVPYDGQYLVRFHRAESDVNELFTTSDFLNYTKLPDELARQAKWVDMNRRTRMVEMFGGAFFAADDGDGWEIHWTDGLAVQPTGIFSLGVDFRNFPDEFRTDGDAVYWTTSDSTLKLIPSDSVARVDYNHNDVVDVGDLDIQASLMSSGQYYPAFDLTGDDRLDLDDRELLLHEFAHTSFGDADFNGRFDSGDFVQVFLAGEYEDQLALNSTWVEGDWDGDGEFSSRDFVVAFLTNTYEQPATAVVPEPSSLLPLLAGLLFATSLRPRGRSCRAA